MSTGPQGRPSLWAHLFRLLHQEHPEHRAGITPSRCAQRWLLGVWGLPGTGGGLREPRCPAECLRCLGAHLPRGMCVMTVQPVCAEMQSPAPATAQLPDPGGTSQVPLGRGREGESLRRLLGRWSGGSRWQPPKGYWRDT